MFQPLITGVVVVVLVPVVQLAFEQRQPFVLRLPSVVLAAVPSLPVAAASVAVAQLAALAYSSQG